MASSRPADSDRRLDVADLVDTESQAVTRVALVGYGYWGSKHVRVLTGIPGVHVTVVESRRDRLLEAKKSFPVIRAAASLAEVQGDLDAVVVATPPRTHAAIAIQALRAGLHTMVEKPLATSVSDAEALVHAAEASGRILMVGHTFEYNAAVWKLKQLITSGELGRILYIDTARLNLGRYQNDCNVIWDLAPHDISIVSYLLDEFPHSVSVWAQRNVGDTYDDIAYLRLNFASSSAFVHVSWLHPNKVRRVTVVGDRKMAVYDDLSDTERIRVYDEGVALADVDDGPAPPMPVTYRTGDIRSPFVEFVEPLLVQDSHFIECVRSGRQPQTSGQRGLDVVKVLAATDKAVVTGAPVIVRPSAADVVSRSMENAEVAS